MIDTLFVYYNDKSMDTIKVGQNDVKSIWFDSTRKVVNVTYDDGTIQCFIDLPMAYLWKRKDNANYIKNI